MNRNFKEILCAIPIGILIGSILIKYQIPIKNTNGYSCEYTNIGNIGLPVPTGSINIDDLFPDINGLGSNRYRYTLNVLTPAEDEYWEIEKLGGNYYRVRREDYDGMDGYYEFDTEEKLGTLEDLYRYIKDHGVHKKY